MITGRHIFNIVYVLNLLFQIIFISYQLLQHIPINSNYLIVACSSVASTTLIYLVVNRKKK